MEIDTPAAWLGVLSACFAIAPLILALPSGAVVDRIGEGNTAMIGGVLITASAVVLALTGNSVIALAVGTCLLGVGHLGSVVAQQTLVANSTSQASKLDSAFGYYTFAASLGQAIGPAALVLFSRGGAVPETQQIFITCSVAGLALLLLAALLRRSEAGAHPADDETATGLGSLLRLPGLAQALLTSSVVLAAVDITLVYLPALGTQRDINASFIGILLTIRGLSSMTTRLFLGRLTGLFGRRNVLVGGTLAAAGALLAMALPVPLWLAGMLMALAGLGLGVGQPITMSWLAASAPPGARGRAMSLRLVGNRAGQVVIPSAAGALAAGAGASGVLGITGAGLLLIAVSARRLPVD
nr:MFS transporter [Kineosporia babensis]